MRLNDPRITSPHFTCQAHSRLLSPMIANDRKQDAGESLVEMLTITFVHAILINYACNKPTLLALFTHDPVV